MASVIPIRRQTLADCRDELLEVIPKVEAAHRAEIDTLMQRWVTKISDQEAAHRDEIARLLEPIEELLKVEWVETEYDGTVYEICPWCDAQFMRPDEDHKKGCTRQIAEAAIRTAKEKANG